MIERLRAIISFYGLSDRAFAIKCGLKQPTLDKQLKGLRAISMETIVAILNTFGDISAEWLMRGVGDMMIKPTAPTDIDRISTLVDTIATLQETINEKNKTISILTEQNQQLKTQLNKWISTSGL